MNLKEIDQSVKMINDLILKNSLDVYNYEADLGSLFSNGKLKGNKNIVIKVFDGKCPFTFNYDECFIDKSNTVFIANLYYDDSVVKNIDFEMFQYIFTTRIYERKTSY